MKAVHAVESRGIARQVGRRSMLRSAVVMSLALIGVVGCGKMPTSVDGAKIGALEIRAAVFTSLPKTSVSLQTTFDSLVIEVSGDDFATIRRSRKLISSSPVLADTVSSIPAGTGRVVKVWTVNSSGTTVHVDSLPAKTVRIDPGITTMVNSVLVPALGSIYLQIGGVPTKVDSVAATFVASDSRLWAARAKRSPRVCMSLDNIPHRTRGVLGVAGIDSTGDTLYKASTEVVLDARTTNSVPLVFTSTPGGLALQIALGLPGATVASGSMSAVEEPVSESGALVVTEIMYAANDSEYVELHNPGSTVVSFDTLILDLDGTDRVFLNVNVAAGQSLVVGRGPLPWADLFHSTTGALDLSAGGNWITLRTKDRAIIDRVIFIGGSNSQEWPVTTGKQSIELRAEATSAAANNFGRNWRAVSTAIDSSTNQCGTPRVR